MNTYIGVDVSKLKLDIHFGNEYFQCDNTKAGLRLFINKLRVFEQQGNSIAVIACEASGGYERLMLKTLSQKNYPVHLAHANHVKHFAKATGLLAKTDKIDAKLIQLYAKVLAIEPDKRDYCEITEEIKELVKRREQLIEDKQREMNRLDTCHPKVKKSLESHIKWLKSRITEIDKQLGELSKHERVKQLYELLTSIPSVGLIVASAIIGYLPELGQLEHKQLAALVGVAPYNHDSGKHAGKRFIQGGRKTLRNYLFMSAVSSLRWNKELKVFYDRLVAKGKSGKVALTAIMRKLVAIINSVVKRQTPWQVKLC